MPLSLDSGAKQERTEAGEVGRGRWTVKEPWGSWGRRGKENRVFNVALSQNNYHRIIIVLLPQSGVPAASGPSSA